MTKPLSRNVSQAGLLRQDACIINQHAKRLNKEAADVLSYQVDL